MPWILVGLIVAVVVGGVSWSVDASETTPGEAFDALASTRYSVPAPEALLLDGPIHEMSSGWDEGVEAVGRIDFHHLINRPDVSGGALLVNYWVTRSPEQANRLLEEALRQASRSNSLWQLAERKEQPRIEAQTHYRIERLDDIGYPHACFLSQGGAWCHATVGIVAVYVESRLDLFALSERPQVAALLRSAIEHLETVI